MPLVTEAEPRRKRRRTWLWLLLLVPLGLPLLPIFTPRNWSQRIVFQWPRPGWAWFGRSPRKYRSNSWSAKRSGGHLNLNLPGNQRSGAYFIY